MDPIPLDRHSWYVKPVQLTQSTPPMSYRSLTQYRAMRARFVPAAQALARVKTSNTMEDAFARVDRALRGVVLGR